MAVFSHVRQFPDFHTFLSLYVLHLIICLPLPGNMQYTFLFPLNPLFLRQCMAYAWYLKMMFVELMNLY